MILEAVIVCVNYADFLSYTLPLNRIHFDKIVVVTSPADKDTQKLCEYYHVQCVQTNVFYEDGAIFNKAKGINVGMQELTQAGWVLHLDGDIVLPPQFRTTLDPIDLDPSFIYGVDRLMCTSYQDWAKHLANPHLTQEDGVYIHPNNASMPIGTRIAKYGTVDGYIPIGFFQLWNPTVSGINHYPQEHGDAGRSDMLFAMLWPRNKRGFIPEIVTIHLESEKITKMGANWQGRTTQQFSPLSIVKEAISLTKPTVVVTDSLGYQEELDVTVKSAQLEAVIPVSISVVKRSDTTVDIPNRLVKHPILAADRESLSVSSDKINNGLYEGNSFSMDIKHVHIDTISMDNTVAIAEVHQIYPTETLSAVILPIVNNGVIKADKNKISVLHFTIGSLFTFALFGIAYLSYLYFGL